MAKFLRCDCSVADAFVEMDSLGVAAPWEIDFDIYVPSATLAGIDGATFGPDVCELDQDETFLYNNGASFLADASWWTDWAPGGPSPAGSLAPDGWISVVVAYDAADNISWTYGGTTYFTYNLVTQSGSSNDPLNFLGLGGINADHVPAQVYFFDNVKVYDAAHALVFQDDFESGNLNAWDFVTGDCSVVSSVLPPVPATHICS